ncbi:MAG: two-component sensor histidine kinase [Enterobacterales bacterium]|nr:two-component sensor histidine kinase [Enterobacterales bacterium]
MVRPQETIRVELEEYLWRALQVFNVYRLLVATAFLLFEQAGLTPRVLGTANPELYSWVVALYFSFAILMIALLVKRYPGYKSSVAMQISLDIIAIVAIIYASGEVNNGLGVLLAVSVGVSSLLIGNSKALAVPAAATIALFAQVFYSHYIDGLDSQFTNSGLLGTSFFIISYLSLTLAKRLYYTEKTVLESKADLASMEAVNQDIIQTLKSGLIVLDESLNIQMLNDAAWRELNMPSAPKMQPLKAISREIYLATKQWLAKPLTDSMLIKLASRNIELQLSFRKLGADEHNLILIFLEDTTKLTQQAQQLKLTSLGRLTASIAHEIRNPLGAISHAAQLLNESEGITENDKDLCAMITRHSLRMNTIIENVLNLSQSRPPQQESIYLESIITQVKKELLQHHDPQPEIDVLIKPQDIQVLFDRSQLQQIINNLCQNGLRYSLENTGTASLHIYAAYHSPSGQAYLDIIDRGKGVKEQYKDKIFEPFFTTSNSGTGLGLYLARELCQSNGANLSYIPLPSEGGSCFRIEFGQ